MPITATLTATRKMSNLSNAIDVYNLGYILPLADGGVAYLINRATVGLKSEFLEEDIN